MSMEMGDRPCPVCGQISIEDIYAAASFDEHKFTEFAFASRKLPEYMHYQLIHCRNCEVIYASPIPEQEWLMNAYENADYDSNEEANYAARTYAGFLPSICQRLPDLHGAMDIGTGNGGFLEELMQYGFTGLVGIEPSISPVKAAKENIRPLIRPTVFSEHDFTPASFSLVTCFQTLEHLYEPMGFIKGVHSILKPGGAAFIIFHNHKSLSARVLGMKSPIYDIEHLQLFSRSSMEFLFLSCGFVNIQIRQVYNKYPLHYWLKLFPMPVGVKTRMISYVNNIGIGRLPILIPAGNLAGIGYKDK